MSQNAALRQGRDAVGDVEPLEVNMGDEAVQTIRQAINILSNQAMRSYPACLPMTISQEISSTEEKKRKFKPPSSKRQQLTAEEAIEIYLQRPAIGKGDRPKRGSMIRCKGIAPKYGVSAKTIRDIWRGRTVRVCVPLCLSVCLSVCRRTIRDTHRTSAPNEDHS